MQQDLDYNCNWLGGYRSIENMAWNKQKQFNAAAWKPLQYDGSVWGNYKNAGKLRLMLFRLKQLITFQEMYPLSKCLGVVMKFLPTSEW